MTKRLPLLLLSHAAVALVGFAAGIYALPILTAPSSPELSALRSTAERAHYKGEFRRNLKDSDPLHWGEGAVSVARDAISLQGRIAPGPDYKLYLSPQFVETKADFIRLKPQMVRVGDVKTFENFLVPVPATIDPGQFTTVIVWCESFSQFITAAKYK
jgi:hypothetical protein